MSGICGIVNLDGCPVEPHLIERMMEPLRFRGPDAEQVWISGNVALGHTMLRTTRESEAERQPLTLDGKVWITADARVDARSELIAALAAHGHPRADSATDPELILRAYQTWGRDCPRHLLGDFAFAIWDAPSRALFCARDQLGVKPFFYACVGDCVVFSNTLNSVRAHPDVSSALNEAAIYDFLVQGFNTDTATSFFADIRRLPPAHTVHCSRPDTAPAPLRYWTPPICEPVRYKRAEDYIDRFNELLECAVSDRLRTDRVALFMSGGLDSVAVAATAKKLLGAGPAAFELNAYCWDCEALFHDEEAHYSRLVGRALGIPVQYLSLAGYRLYDGWNEFVDQMPEPVHNPLFALWLDSFRATQGTGRVCLTGEGGDEIFRHNWRSYLAQLWRAGRYARILAEALPHVWRHRRRLLTDGLPARLRRYLLPQKNVVTIPAWVRADLAKRAGSVTRASGLLNGRQHPFHPAAHQILTSAILVSFLEAYDAQFTFTACEARHPLLDVRLVEYALSIPPVPWCQDKHLLRMAMPGCVPEEIRRRQKTPLAADPVQEVAKRQDVSWVDALLRDRCLAPYVHPEKLPRFSPQLAVLELWTALAPASLRLWLTRQAPLGLKCLTGGS
jgi:asparagine synthase (glutamine-hydrolysing)